MSTHQDRPSEPEANLDATDLKILDAIQRSVPLTPRPFESLARCLDLSEQDLIDRLRRIRDEQDLISQIAAIFDTKRLGYESALVAAEYPDARVDEAARVVCRHPGVSHCYLRTGPYNLWYTLAIPPDSKLGLAAAAAKLSELSGAESHRVLGALKVYKIGVRLPLGPQQTPEADEVNASSHVRSAAMFEPTEQNRRLVDALQQDLPIEPEPFSRIASQVGVGVNEILAAGESFLSRGIMRRYAAVLRHRKVGFAVNCMTVWQVDPADADEVGHKLGRFAEVTHCYLRPTWPDWPYNLYAMVHCRSEQHCRDVLARMSEATGLTDRLTLYSLKEYKKVRLRYFSPEFEQWESQHSK